MVWARAFRTGTLVPARIAKCTSAKRASSISRGSTTTRRAPASTACLILAPTIGWFSVGFSPLIRKPFARSMSSKELVAAPVPSMAFMATAVGPWHTRAQQSTLFEPSTTRANFWAR